MTHQPHHTRHHRNNSKRHHAAPPHGSPMSHPPRNDFNRHYQRPPHSMYPNRRGCGCFPFSGLFYGISRLFGRY